MRKLQYITLCFFVGAGHLFAESIQPVPDGNIVYAGAGVDGAVVLEGGYVTPQLFSLLPLDISLAIPTGKIFNTPGSYRLGLHTHWTRRFYNNWGFNLTPGTRIYTLRTPAWSGFAWHLDFQGQVGYIAEKWAATLDLGLSPKLTTYVGINELVTQNFPEAKSGFYAKGFEAMLHYGVSGYWRFTDHFAAGLRLWLTLPIEDSKSPLARTVTDGVISFNVTYYFDAIQKKSEKGSNEGGVQ
ncbi:MAG TPA: hypothetical protein PLY93_08140 [Turneriella sp.]|nr:hypothetical protein [Turneriella sp.]